MATRAIEDAEVAVGDHDRVDPPPHRPLTAGATITIERVEIVERVVEVTIEHGEERRETDELTAGDTRVVIEGEDGLRRETWAVTLVEGEETDRELVGEEAVRVPTDRVVLVGTRPEPEQEPALRALAVYA